MWKCVSSIIDIIENTYNFCYTMGTIKFEVEQLQQMGEEAYLFDYLTLAGQKVSDVVCCPAQAYDV